MKILLCQIAPQTGALKQNFAIMQKHYAHAQEKEANICVFPELSLTGYLAEDLFLNPNFIKDTKKHIDKLVNITGKTCLLISAPIVENGLLYNVVIAAQGGKIIGQTYKHKLPNYGVFDEDRYFTPGDPQVISINNYKIGVPICEDIWSDSVCNELKKQGAQILITVNASPFEEGKIQRRLDQITKIFNDTKLPVLYCNQVAAQDGIIFDGNSFCLDGKLQVIGKSFEETIQILKLKDNKFYPEVSYKLASSPYEDIYKAMVIGTQHYVRENNFSKIVIGLSGGIDSAMVASVAVDAFGSKNVSAIMLPSKFTSKESIDDAKQMAKILNISLKTINIDEAVSCLAKTIDESNEDSITYQNLQSRIRGTILMAESNRSGALLLTTGNKSEYATGYATIYGDMNGAFNPIKDIYKTDLYELARYKNIIPQSIIEKAPSAELRHDQKDSDSLPEYETLDQILKLHIEYSKGAEDLSKQFPADIVNKVLALVKNSEFKRRQAAPGVKISIKNFEKDRRFPITNHYDTTSDF